MSDKQRIVMFHIGRSGSTVLADQMARHPDIHWDGEIFEVRNRRWDGEEDPVALLRRRMGLVAGGIYGFEFKFFHAALIGMSVEHAAKHFISENFDRFIVLKRFNYLKKIVSSRVAVATSRWSIANGTQAPLSRIRLDIGCLSMDAQKKPLLAFLQDYDAQFERISGLLDGFPVLWLSYEDHIKTDPSLGYAMVCDFLNVPVHQSTVRHGRTTPFKLRQVIENYDEVCKALNNTPYAWMLEE